MLTKQSVASYLIMRSFGLEYLVLEGNLAVSEALHRHANFHVTADPGPCYLVKQAIGSSRSRTLGHEAETYSLLTSHPGAELLIQYLPRFYLYDPKGQVLILELFPKSRDLRWYYRDLRRFPVYPAQGTGRFLAALHKLPVVAEKADAKQPARMPLPAAFLFHRPLVADHNGQSTANRKLTWIIEKYPEFCQQLDQLRGEWREDAFIHGDIKWANILLTAPNESGKRELKIVDWELAGVGDACWDVGSVFNDYLSFWLLSIPITGEDPPERFLDLARYPLSKMQPAMRAFWDTYCSAMGFDQATAREQLIRSVRYAAAKLVQTAFEQSQAAAEPTDNVICFLQVALNMLERPEQAAMHLLGIPWQKVWGM